MNTELDWKRLNTLLINSFIRTVLPTPAPPSKPNLAPFWIGAKKSITLIPVYKISVLIFNSLNENSVIVLDYNVYDNYRNYNS